MKRFGILLLLLSCGCANQVPHAKIAEAPQVCDPTHMWEMSDGYHQYHCDPATATITRDTEAERILAEEDSRHRLLAHALVTRCLSGEELGEALELGYMIYVRNMEPFYEDDLRRRFTSDLETQSILRRNCR